MLQPSSFPIRRLERDLSFFSLFLPIFALDHRTFFFFFPRALAFLTFQGCEGSFKFFIKLCRSPFSTRLAIFLSLHNGKQFFPVSQLPPPFHLKPVLPRSPPRRHSSPGASFLLLFFLRFQYSSPLFFSFFFCKSVSCLSY